MTFFPDLSPYEYASDPDHAYNVGWLDESTPFPTGPTSTAFRQKLLSYCRPQYVVQHYMGAHTCQFCTEPDLVVHVQWESKRIGLGNGEIRVIGTDVVYAAPTLIYHYVADHDYQPPQEFVEAVLNGPGPGSGEHQILIDMVNGRFRRPALPPEFKKRLVNRGGQVDAPLAPEALSRLLEEAGKGRPLSLQELAEALRGMGSQLEPELVSRLVANTQIGRRRANRLLKRAFENYEFGMIISLGEMVQILQDQLPVERGTPRMREAVAGGMIDDLRDGKWNLPAPLPDYLEAYAAVLDL